MLYGANCAQWQPKTFKTAFADQWFGIGFLKLQLEALNVIKIYIFNNSRISQANPNTV